MTMLYIVIAAITFLSVAVAECPNGCSKNGLCGKYDSCTCFKNYMGNDCGDAICPFGFAHVDTAKGDLNMNNAIDNTATTVAVGSQMYPQGTTEIWPNSQANEGHFYMECSNKGMCDRNTGVCNCQVGYEGSSCQRAVCPNDCSGHGSCHTIRYLAQNAGGTLYGEYLDVGSTTYDLWDADMTMGCKCDPRYSGPSCATKACLYGVDPLYLSAGYPIYETIQIRINTATGGDTQLRFFDRFNEAYITERITVGDDSSDAAGGAAGTFAYNFAQAFLNLPNGVVPSVVCDLAGSATFKFVPFVTYVGIHTVCSFVSNPGKLRLAQFADTTRITGSNVQYYVLPTTQTGEDSDMCPTLSLTTVSTTFGSTAAVLASADSTVPSTLSLFKINNQYTIATVTGTSMVLAVKWGPVSASAANFWWSSNAVADTGATAAWAIGSKTLTSSADLTSYWGASFSDGRGATIFVENVLYVIQSTTSTTITVNKPFPGLAATGAAATVSKIYSITRSTANEYQYTMQCSGRGQCDTTYGICKCFEGYTHDSCDVQDTLAM